MPQELCCLGTNADKSQRLVESHDSQRRLNYKVMLVPSLNSVELGSVSELWPFSSSVGVRSCEGLMPPSLPPLGSYTVRIFKTCNAWGLLLDSPFDLQSYG